MREAIRGTVELSGQNEEDFIHQILAFFVGNIIINESECVSLKGESVDEDYELFKQYWTMKKEGKNVLLHTSGGADQLRIMDEAMRKFRTEMGKKIEVDYNSPNPNISFNLLFENIDHENEWVHLQEQKSLEMMKGEITLDEYEEFVDKEGKKHREEKGYLQSEVPFQLIRRTQMLGIPPSMLNFSDEGTSAAFDASELIEEIIELGKTIDSDKHSLQEVVKFLGYWEILEPVVIKVLGKKKAKKIVKRTKKLQDDINKFLE